jgi:hypothetical protein
MLFVKLCCRESRGRFHPTTGFGRFVFCSSNFHRWRQKGASNTNSMFCI